MGKTAATQQETENEVFRPVWSDRNDGVKLVEDTENDRLVQIKDLDDSDLGGCINRMTCEISATMELISTGIDTTNKLIIDGAQLYTFAGMMKRQIDTLKVLQEELWKRYVKEA